jgi:cyclophilin family peptidyl-prolyl cis-trans isomerase
MHMIKPQAIVAALFLACLAMPAAAQTQSAAADPVASLPDGLYANMVTPRGTIVIELYADKAPLAVANFVGLAEGSFVPGGKPYYDGVVFHRVEPGFVIQGGDPAGTGRGGPGYQFPNEIDPSMSFGTAGVLGMANAGPDTNGSQFFITLGPAKFLDGSYTIFGRVAAGMSVVQAIKKGDAMQSVRIVRKAASPARSRLTRPDSTPI